MKEFKDLFKGVEEIEVEDFSLDAAEIEFDLLPQLILSRALKKISETPAVKRAFEKKFVFTPPKETYKLAVREATIGGGKRKSVTIGGETVPPLYFFEGKPPHKPIISHDVFDIPFRLPSSVKKLFADVMSNPAEWAKKQVKEYGADMVTLHLISTDPIWSNRPASEAAKTIEDVLQAIDVPIIVSGSGNYEKDIEVLTKAAEVTEGENVLLSSVGPNMDYKKVVAAAVKHKHLILSLVSMDVPGMKQMNKNIIKEDLPPERIIMDPNTASLGYGIEYTITTMERIRLNALRGDSDLAMPILSGSSNAWSAREAWMKDDALGPPELRGPLWEATTALVALLSGADLFMMLHPAAIHAVKTFIDEVFDKPASDVDYRSWVTMK